MKRSAFVWAIGLDVIAPVSGRCEIFEGVRLTAALIVHFQWKRLASSYVTERPWMERQSVTRVNEESLVV